MTKTIVFTGGVAVGTLATVGVAIGSALFALNKITEGEVADLMKTAFSEVKDVFRERKETMTCDSPSVSPSASSSASPS